jgi:hypothetical protein
MHESRDIIIPVWHKVNESDIARYSPALADRLAIPTSMGIPAMAEKIIKALRRRQAHDGAG